VLFTKLSPHLARKLAELSGRAGDSGDRAWELANRLEIPYRVVINEAVELAKSFGGTDGHRFVNGVLDKVAATRVRRRSPLRSPADRS
jgi:N utilization substance protein B